MAYVIPNFKTKKGLKIAVANGDPVEVYQPGGIFTIPRNCRIAVEGPHSPKPHTWYADVDVVDGKVVKVR